MNLQKRNPIIEKSEHEKGSDTAPSSETEKVESGHRKFYHSKPVHLKCQPSPLSPEAPVQNYKGFINLAFLLLFVTNFRLVIENFTKYGVLLTLPGKGIPFSDYVVYLTILGCYFLNGFASYLIEKALSLNTTRDMYKVFAFAIGVNCLLTLFVPIYYIWYYMYHPLFGIVILLQGVIMFMKLISYHVVNRELRANFITKANLIHDYKDLEYPNNVTLPNLLYFALAPTLCYQPVYPQTKKIRIWFLFKSCMELITVLLMQYFLLEQYAVPTVVNSIKPLRELNIPWIVERVLKLSISSLYIWLLIFYAFFHSFLNILAEVLYFGDRLFYSTWWNATTLDEYWREWNLPVHHWFKRHVYVPLRKRGISGSSSLLITFFISAVFHEVVLGVSTHVIHLLAFSGMVFQIPLVWITGKVKALRPNSAFGNYLFWISFCIIGQPVCAILYYNSWIELHSKR